LDPLAIDVMAEATERIGDLPAAEERVL